MTNRNNATTVHRQAAKDARLQELELKVQHLESKLIEQEKLIHHHMSHNYVNHSAVKETVHLLDKHAAQEKRYFRTCREIYQADPSLNSGMYWIDPDGYGIEYPIHVHCDRITVEYAINL